MPASQREGSERALHVCKERGEKDKRYCWWEQCFIVWPSVSLDGFILVGKLLVVVKKATCYIL